jgi:hypothetical protein
MLLIMINLLTACDTHMCYIGSTDGITELCLHLGRIKNSRQALFLVKRYKRAVDALPAAEAKLVQVSQELGARQIGPPADGWPAFIQSAKAELQNMAQGAIPGHGGG